MFADLAAQTLAWQQDADTDSANLPAADPTDGKVLRFDPTLGADGGFYFVSWNSSQSQQQVAGTEGATLPSQLEHGQQLQWEQQTSTCPTDAPPFVKIQPQKEQQPCTLSVSQQLAQLRPAPGSDNADTTHARTVPADTCLQTGAAPSTAHAARDDVQLHTVALPGLSGLQAIAAAGVHPSAAAVGPSAATTAVAAVPFPIEGGGEAGRLLRAAAAAASGCSHELVVAAAGPCDVERAR